MADREPSTELGAFSSDGAAPTPWAQARAALRDAPLYWLSTVRPDGRPHVTPLLGIWLAGAAYFCTGPTERKARNLTQNRQCVLTTGCNQLDGLDLVVEGEATLVDDEAELGSVAGAFESKYGAHFTAPEGTWFGLGDAIRDGSALVHRVDPTTAFGFGKGKSFSQTRWRFDQEPNHDQYRAGNPNAKDQEIQPHRIKIADDELADLSGRLARVRWAPQPAGGDNGYGVSVARVRELVEHWRDRYDWRAWEARLNAYPQYTTTIDRTNVHFLHIRSPEPDALPLILSHGWPGSVAEYLDILGPLSDPARHGLDPTIAFDVVVPSLPGFGFSGPTPDTGWGPHRIARAWAVLMRRLGYQRYGAAGNDWGSVISLNLGRIVPDNMIGVHVTQAWSPPPDDDPAWLTDLSPRDKTALEAFQHYVDHEASYGAVQGQQPQTLAHALADSPVGLLGWNAQAMRDLDADALLTHVTIHWLTNTAGSAIRIYAEQERETPPAGPTTVPLGVAQFQNDLASIRTFAEHRHTNIISWNHYDRGGHYAAHDASDLLVADIRQLFATLRSAPSTEGE